jgi:periplasmic divalent cation tolerance protein
MADAAVLVLTTAPSAEAGTALAETLLEERLIACANLVPGLLSIYRWKGAVEREGEVLVVMKTVESRVARLFERAAQLHPYEVPELIALPVAAIAEPYGSWLRGETIEVTA